MKKKLSIALIVLASVLLIAGCSDNRNTNHGETLVSVDKDTPLTAGKAIYNITKPSSGSHVVELTFGIDKPASGSTGAVFSIYEDNTVDTNLIVIAGENGVTVGHSTTDINITYDSEGVAYAVLRITVSPDEYSFEVHEDGKSSPKLSGSESINNTTSSIIIGVNNPPSGTAFASISLDNKYEMFANK